MISLQGMLLMGLLILLHPIPIHGAFMSTRMDGVASSMNRSVCPSPLDKFGVQQYVSACLAGFLADDDRWKHLTSLSESLQAALLISISGGFRRLLGDLRYNDQSSKTLSKSEG